MDSKTYPVSQCDRVGFATHYPENFHESYEKQTVAVIAKNYGPRTIVDVKINQDYKKSSRHVIGSLVLDPAQSTEFACTLLGPMEVNCVRNAKNIAGLINDAMRLLDKGDAMSLSVERALLRDRVMKFMRGEQCD